MLNKSAKVIFGVLHQLHTSSERESSKQTWSFTNICFNTFFSYWEINWFASKNILEDFGTERIVG